MNFFSPILRLFNMGGLSNQDTGYQSSGGSTTSTAAGTSVTDERALKVSAVWACVQLIANSVSGLPISIYNDTETGRKPIDRRHFLKDLLLYSPNKYMKPRDFRSAMTVQMSLWGNAYAEIVRSGERIVALMPLRPGRMTPYITENGDLQYHYNMQSGIKVYAQQSILHLKGFGVDGIVAASRNDYAREAYGLTVAAETFAAKQFANGGRPGGVITFDAFLKPEQREQAKKLYEGLAEGAINSNRLWILEGGSKYDALDFTADQMQMIGTRAQQLSEIARFFGVPGVMIGAGETGSSSWPASFEQQMLSFLTFTLQAYLDEWESALVHALLPMGSSIGIDHDTAPLVKMDSAARSNYWSRLVQNGLATRNEGRIAMNLPRAEDPGADRLTVQTNLVQLEDLQDVSQSSEPTRTLPTEVRQ
jgi:HK97 family phage portal protein